jgi:hypothetical protein
MLGGIIAWEYQDCALMAEHFFTVASYNLQHPAPGRAPSVLTQQMVFFSYRWLPIYRYVYQLLEQLEVNFDFTLAGTEIRGMHNGEQQWSTLPIPDELWGDTDRNNFLDPFVKQSVGTRLFIDSIITLCRFFFALRGKKEPTKSGSG